VGGGRRPSIIPQKFTRFCGQEMLEVSELEPFLSDLIGLENLNSLLSGVSA